MGSGIENGIGVGYMIFLYTASGIGGNLLSSVCNPAAYGVGASTAVFGLVGFYISYLFTNWSSMQRARGGAGQQIFLIVFVSTLILLNLNIGPNQDTKVDNWGHLGGLITGIFAGLAITEFQDSTARGKNRIPDRFTEREYKERSKCRN